MCVKLEIDMHNRYLIIVVAAAACFGVSYKAVAQNTVAESAILCSGLYYVMSSLPENGGISVLVQSMYELYGLHESDRRGSILTRGEVDAAKNAAAKRMGELYDRNPSAVVDEFFRCRNWQLDIAAYYASNGITEASGKSLTEDEVTQVMLGIPTTLSDWGSDGPDRQRIEPLVLDSFSAWDEGGRMTTDEFKKVLKEIISEQNETKSVER